MKKAIKTLYHISSKGCFCPANTQRHFFGGEGRRGSIQRENITPGTPTGNWRLIAMEAWIRGTESFPFNSLMFSWVQYNTPTEQNTQLSSDESVHMCTFCGCPVSCARLCHSQLLAQEQSGLGRGRYGFAVTSAIAFAPHQLRLPKPKPLHPSCHCQEQFALYRTTYAFTYRKLPLFVSKIIFVSHTSPLPIPYCDWICFLCDGAGAGLYSPAGELGNLLFPFSHYPLVCSERFSLGITAAELRQIPRMRHWQKLTLCAM